MNNSELIFMYLLLRDVAPVGEITRIVQQVEKCKQGLEPEFTNQYLFDLAKSLVERINK